MVRGEAFVLRIWPKHCHELGTTLRGSRAQSFEVGNTWDQPLHSTPRPIRGDAREPPKLSLSLRSQTPPSPAPGTGAPALGGARNNAAGRAGQSRAPGAAPGIPSPASPLGRAGPGAQSPPVRTPMDFAGAFGRVGRRELGDRFVHDAIPTFRNCVGSWRGSPAWCHPLPSLWTPRVRLWTE